MCWRDEGGADKVRERWRRENGGMWVRVDVMFMWNVDFRLSISNTYFKVSHIYILHLDSDQVLRG